MKLEMQRKTPSRQTCRRCSSSTIETYIPK